MRHNLLNPDGSKAGTFDRTDAGPQPGAIVWRGKTYIREPASTAYRQGIVITLGDDQVTTPTVHKANPIANPDAASMADRADDPPNG